MNFILAQVFGGIALILFIVSYFCNDKKLFFLIQIIGDIFYGLSFAVNLALVAGINTFISIIRGILFYIYERKKERNSLYMGDNFFSIIFAGRCFVF